MAQSEAYDASYLVLIGNYDWMADEMKRYYCRQFEIAIEKGLRQCKKHLDTAVKNGMINDQDECRSASIITQTLSVMIRNKDYSELKKKMFEELFDKFAAALPITNVVHLDFNPDITMAEILPERYHDIAKPFIDAFLLEYKTAIDQGQNEAIKLLKNEEEIDLWRAIELFRKEIEKKCKEAMSPNKIDKVTDKIIGKLLSNLANKSTTEFTLDYADTISDSMKTNKVSARTSSSSAHGLNPKPGQTNTSESSSGSSIDKNPDSNGLSSVAKDISSKDDQNGRSNVSNSILPSRLSSLALSSDDKEEERVVIKSKARSESLFSDSAANSIAGSSRTPSIRENGKRPRPSAGSYRDFFPSDDEIENPRQVKRMLQGYGSDSSSDSEFYNSCSSNNNKEIQNQGTKSMYNYEERVTELLGEGIETNLYISGLSRQFQISLGDKKRLKCYLSKDWLYGKGLRVENKVFIKLQLGEGFTYIDNEHGKGAKLLLSKQKFNKNDLSLDDKRIYQIFLGRYRPSSQEIIQEIVQNRSIS